MDAILKLASVKPEFKITPPDPAFCHTCRKAVATARRCSQCKAAVYCNVECQNTDWKAGHRESCSTYGLCSRLPPQLLERVPNAAPDYLAHKCAVAVQRVFVYETVLCEDVLSRIIAHFRKGTATGTAYLQEIKDTLYDNYWHSTIQAARQLDELQSFALFLRLVTGCGPCVFLVRNPTYRKVMVEQIVPVSAPSTDMSRADTPEQNRLFKNLSCYAKYPF